MTSETTTPNLEDTFEKALENTGLYEDLFSRIEAWVNNQYSPEDSYNIIKMIKPLDKWTTTNNTQKTTQVDSDFDEGICMDETPNHPENDQDLTYQKSKLVEDIIYILKKTPYSKITYNDNKVPYNEYHNGQITFYANDACIWLPFFDITVGSDEGVAGSKSDGEDGGYNNGNVRGAGYEGVQDDGHDSGVEI